MPVFEKMDVLDQYQGQFSKEILEAYQIGILEDHCASTSLSELNMNDLCFLQACLGF